MDYELRKMGRREFHVPVDWRVGEMVTWDEGDETRVGMVTGFRLDEVKRAANPNKRVAYFFIDMASGVGMRHFEVNCVMWRGEGQSDFSVMDCLATSLPRKM
jgi:hypothetical protein